ncbi:hypothetical protein ACFX11_012384 [Malus domestica]
MRDSPVYNLCFWFFSPEMQTCTARQFPPAEVAQVLDEAVTSLQPFCPQNPSVYGEIHKCMGIVRNQTLALVLTWFHLTP